MFAVRCHHVTDFFRNRHWSDSDERAPSCHPKPVASVYDKEIVDSNAKKYRAEQPDR
jgi:hypothetical protein